MKTILTHQSAQYQGADIFIIDGQKSSFSNFESQIDARNLINDASGQLFEKRIHCLPFLSEKPSKSLKVFITPKGELVVSSIFMTTDDKGRRISYYYYCNSIENPARVIRLFSDDCSIAGMMPQPGDVKSLETYLIIYNKRKHYYLAGIVATVIIIALITILGIHSIHG